jgi:hypothetical protein
MTPMIKGNTYGYSFFDKNHNEADEDDEFEDNSISVIEKMSPIVPKRSLSRAASENENEDWQPWIEVVREKYPSVKSKLAEYSDFFISFKETHSIEDFQIPGTNTALHGWLPKRFHEQFLQEFEQEFDDILENVESSTPTESSASTPLLGRRRVDKTEVSKISTPWKDIIRRSFPSYKFDNTTEKRIRLGITAFLSEQASKVGVDSKHLIPNGNSGNQYMIPNALTDLFIAWFKEEQKSDFRKVADAKRKASAQDSGSKRQRVVDELDIGNMRINNLDVEMINRPDLKLTDYKE